MVIYLLCTTYAHGQCGINYLSVAQCSCWRRVECVSSKLDHNTLTCVAADFTTSQKEGAKQNEKETALSHVNS